jgi:hypothetical protein
MPKVSSISAGFRQAERSVPPALVTDSEYQRIPTHSRIVPQELEGSAPL